ncbi:hypothetical protein [Luteimonas notoginsengisoli]|jgi:hypothetical protein|uniref:Transposase n=1 Tax=Luteimonas notoginsengisoli TaxID=1578200 RepID=A0ABV7USR4_9GAMM
MLGIVFPATSMDIGSAETERFFEQQLVKHRFPGDWAQDIAFAYRDCVVLTPAQWRYCAWAAVRRGASLAQQQGPHADGTREAIYQEVRRRASVVPVVLRAAVPFRYLPRSQKVR